MFLRMYPTSQLTMAEPLPFKVRSVRLPDLVKCDRNSYIEKFNDQPDIRLQPDDFPLDLFNQWGPTWLANCGRMPGDGKSIVQLSNQDLVLAMLADLYNWADMVAAPVISVSIVGDIDSIQDCPTPKAIIIGTIHEGGSVYSIPVDVFKSFVVRKVFLDIFQSTKIIKAMFGTCALLEVVQQWFNAYSTDRIEFKSAASVFDIEQFFNGHRLVSWDSQGMTCMVAQPSYNSSFRRFVGLPECNTLAEVFALSFRLANIPDVMQFGSFWSEVNSWSTLPALSHKNQLMALAMRQIDLVYLFAICSEARVACHHDVTIFKSVGESIRDSWKFPRNIQKSAWVLRATAVPVEQACAPQFSKGALHKAKVGGDDGMVAEIVLLSTNYEAQDMEVDEGLPADQLMPQDVPMNPLPVQRVVSRYVFNILKNYEDEAHVFSATWPKCLYFRYNAAYARYRFVCTKVSQLPTVQRHPEYLSGACKILFRFIVGKAPGKLWFEFWRQRVPTRSETNNMRREKLAQTLRANRRRLLAPKLQAHRPARRRFSSGVPTWTFFKELGRIRMTVRSFWLRALAAQRRSMHSTTEVKMLTQRYLTRAVKSTLRVASQRHIRPSRTRHFIKFTKQRNTQTASTPASSSAARPTSRYSTEVLQAFVERVHNFKLWREANNIRTEIIPDDASWDVKIAAYDRVSKEFSEWCQIVRQGHVRPKPFLPEDTTTHLGCRVDDWLDRNASDQQALIDQLRELLITRRGFGPMTAEAIAREHVMSGNSGFEGLIENLQRH